MLVAQATHACANGEETAEARRTSSVMGEVWRFADRLALERGRHRLRGNDHLAANAHSMLPNTLIKLARTCWSSSFGIYILDSPRMWANVINDGVTISTYVFL